MRERLARFGSVLFTEALRKDEGIFMRSPIHRPGAHMLKTLIVEDNAFFRQTVCELLRARFPDMRVEEAEDGVEARAKVARFHPDLILMDIQLPGESGLELCRCIRGEMPGTTIIVCTSYDLPEYREASQQVGASHFVVKGSSTIDELLTLVGDVITDCVEE